MRLSRFLNLLFEPAQLPKVGLVTGGVFLVVSNDALHPFLEFAGRHPIRYARMKIAIAEPDTHRVKKVLELYFANPRICVGSDFIEGFPNSLDIDIGMRPAVYRNTHLTSQAIFNRQIDLICERLYAESFGINTIECRVMFQRLWDHMV